MASHFANWPPQLSCSSKYNQFLLPSWGISCMHRNLRTIKKKLVDDWAMSVSRTLQKELLIAGIKPATFWLQSSHSHHQATQAEGRSKRSIDCLPPAACIIIEQLFGALNAQSSHWVNPEDEYYSTAQGNLRGLKKGQRVKEIIDLIKTCSG